jgi:uncharacterized phosphosugar-binding protein
MTMYYQAVTELLENIYQNNKESIEKAAVLLVEAVKKDQIVHAIGPGGHSNMGVEELFWRAGGLANFNAILDAGTNLIHGAKRSNIVERTPGYAKSVLDAYRVAAGEVIIIVNAYGINSMTIDTALEAKKRGLKTIGVSSKSFADKIPADHPARHPSGKKLYDLVDVFLDNHLPFGDAVVEFEGFPQKIAPTSTIVNCFTLNMLVATTVEKLLEEGIDPPVWVSANMPGGDEANVELDKKYRGRITHL